MSLWAEGAAPGTPYWWEGADWSDLTDPPPDSVDLLIVGAGYTGLSAALAAVETGASVAVLEAGQPGQGASTRNGGMFGAHPRLSWEALSKHFGPGVADAIFAEAGPALAFVQDLITREGIDCDLQPTGRIQLAWSKGDFDAQKRLAEVARNKGGVDCKVLERDALTTEIRTEQYFGGLVFPEHCAIHPQKFHNGLLAACLKRGVHVTGHCPADRITRNGHGFDVQAGGHRIRAKRVLMATNGYTPRNLTPLARRVFPVPSYLIATEPLGENRIRDLAPGGRMMVETRSTHSYFRASPDGRRILFGGRAALVPIPLPQAAARLREIMGQIWPSMASVRLSHVWTGNTGYSFTHMPHVGVSDGVHYAAGFSGSGTVMAPYLGAKAAWQALEDPRGETAYSETRLETRWFHHGGVPAFMQGANLWYRHRVDAREKRAGRDQSVF